MDPITGLVAIIQLIGMFRQEVGSREQKTHEDFMNWLEAHKHEEIKDLISETFHLQEQVNVLLRDDHDRIIDQISELSKITLSIAKQLNGLAPIVTVGESVKRLPKQAVELMYSLCRNDNTGFEFVSVMGGQLLCPIPNGSTASISEPEFIEEDCDLLVSLGYLALDSRGNNLRYKITREGKEFGDKLVLSVSKSTETL